MLCRSLVLSCLLLWSVLAACSGATVTVSQPQTTPSSSTPVSSLSPTPTSSAAPPQSSPTPSVYGDLTGVWQSEDHGLYFLRQVGNHVAWAGFSAGDGISYTNAYCATRTGNNISGNWADVPRGLNAGSGTLQLHVDASNPHDVQIRKTAGGGFGPSIWRKYTAAVTVDALNPVANPSAINTSSLTGTWYNETDTNGRYYLRQVNNAVWWLGMSGDNGKLYTNVFCGSRSGNTFSGNWSDVPRGQYSSSGHLSLQYVFTPGAGITPDLEWFTKTSQTVAFAGTNWTRFTAPIPHES